VLIQNVQVKDVYVSPAVQVSLGACGVTNETLSNPGLLGAGSSSDTIANDEIWSILAPGASVTSYWAHKAEVDHG
jgi:hypothetical protein